MYELVCADGFNLAGAEETYVLHLIPMASGLAATSSDRCLRLFDPLRLSQGPLSTVQTDNGALTCAKPLDASQFVICASGDNGTVSVWDLRQKPENARVGRIQGNNNTSILSLACSGQTNTIAAGTELANHQALIFLWDLRSPASPILTYDEVHSDDVTELTYHPTRPYILITGSTDGLVNVCDVRVADQDDAVLQAFNHGASVHRAGFLTDAGDVFVASHDEKLALYDARPDCASGAATANFGDLRPVLHCQYLADVRPKAAVATGAGAVLGVGAQDQQAFQLIHLTKTGESWRLDTDSAVSLPGAHGVEIVRCCCFFDEQQLVLTGGEDGCVKAWRPGA